MRALIRLYPARWRARYGRELEQLAHDLAPSRSRPALAIDLIRGAFDAHVQQRFDMNAMDWRATRRGALLAVLVWLALAIEIVLTNVVFPTTGDNDAVPVVVSYLCVFAALFLVGTLAARDGAGSRGQLVAGAVAGVLVGLLTAATFLVVDNVWLDIVSRQQSKIDGYAQSGASSMRQYINHGLYGATVFLSLVFGVCGALLSRAGGALAGGAPHR